MFEKFGYPECSNGGEKILTTREGMYKDMLMDIRVYKLKSGMKINFNFERDEAAFLLVTGRVDFIVDEKTFKGERKSCFDQGPYCLHLSKGTPVTIKALEDTELLVQVTENSRDFKSRFYVPEDCSEIMSGVGMCEDTAVRLVRTIFDYSTAPYSNMVMGEVVGRQGGWSSYIPHHHPQPEVYYYHFDRPEGFGASFIGDEVFKIKDGSFCAIPGGLTHPQVTAPGYRLYTCWMIRHFDNNPWTDRINDPAYEWLISKK